MKARLGILLAVLAASLQFLGLFDHDLRLPDEPREAEIAREYAVREGRAVPQLNGGRWLEKPPLYHWAAALAFQAAGKATPGLARLPSALAGLGIGLLAWLLARRLGGTPWAAAFLAWTSAELLNASHAAMVDALFAFLVTASLTCFALGHLMESRRTAVWDVLCAFAAGLSFLAKAHLGPMLVGVSILACCAMRRDLKPLKSLLSPLPLLVFLGTVLPWPALLWSHEHQGDLWQEEISRLAGHPRASTGAHEAVREVLWGQMLDRTRGGSYGHAQPAWYYLPRLFLYAAPASVGLLFALPWAWKRRREPLAALCTGWILGSVFLLSLPSAKRAIYLVPCVAPAAVLVAAWGQAFLERREVLRRILVPLLGIAVIAGWMVVGQRAGAVLDRTESFAPLAAGMKARSEGRVMIGYRLSENQQGAFCFALGQRLRCFTEEKYLLEALGEGRRLVVIPRTAWEELSPGTRGLLRLKLERETAGILFVVAATSDPSD